MQCIFSSSSIHSLILCVRMGLRDVKLGSNTHKAMYLLKNLSAFLKDFFLRSEEHTSELQSQSNLVCRLLLEKKKLHLLSQFGESRRKARWVCNYRVVHYAEVQSYRNVYPATLACLRRLGLARMRELSNSAD